MVWEGCDILIDLQEIGSKLEEQNKKLSKIGDSLWHSKFRKWIVTVRKSNKSGRILEQFSK